MLACAALIIALIWWADDPFMISYIPGMLVGCAMNIVVIAIGLKFNYFRNVPRQTRGVAGMIYVGDTISDGRLKILTAFCIIFALVVTIIMLMYFEWVQYFIGIIAGLAVFFFTWFWPISRLHRNK